MAYYFGGGKLEAGEPVGHPGRHKKSIESKLHTEILPKLKPAPARYQARDLLVVAKR